MEISSLNAATPECPAGPVGNRSDRPDPRQLALWRAMSPAERIAQMDAMREGSLSLKRAMLRSQRPDATTAEIEALVREWFRGSVKGLHVPA